MTESVTQTRVVRRIPNVNLSAIDALAETEQLDRTTMIRLLFSFATYRWEPGWRGTLGSDSHTMRLLPGGIAAVELLAEREPVTFDVMAAQLISFGLAEWLPGWRKDVPGQPSPHGIIKSE